MPSAARSALSVILTLCCALVLALAAPLGALAAGPTITFAAAANYDLATNAYAWDVALGDLDNDGDLDMVATETVNNRIGVRKGVGNGTFGFKTNYTSANHPTAIVIADLDRDGDLDVAVSCADSDVVTVFLGNGTGALGSALNYAVGDYPARLACGDVDNDGDLDLVAANRDGDTVSVILNAGDATFGAATNYSVGDAPLHVVLADLNRDGWLDMAVSNHGDGDLSVLLSDNTGSFYAAVDYPVDASPNGVTVGDYNGDGAPDLAVANEFWGNVSVLLNDGDGTFASAVHYAVGYTPYKVVAVDLNRDGALDLAVTRLMDVTVSVLTGVGDGTFGAQTTFVAGDFPLGITSADLNGDGKPDLAVANNTYSGDVHVLLNDTDIPATLLGEATSYSLGDYPGALALGDLDLDGDLDLVTSSDDDTIVNVGLNDGAGAYTISTPVAIDNYAVALALADLDHDGDLDLVTTNPDSPASSASVRLGDGAGGFSGSTKIVLGDAQYAMVLGDVNGDGDLDLLTAGYYGDGNVLMGDGAGGFGGTGTLTVGTIARDMALGDIDRDGDLDLVVSASQGKVVSVRLNDGAGAFSGNTEVSLAGGPMGVALADVDHDGDLDLVADRGLTDHASVRLNDGAGNFGGGYDIPTGDDPFDVALGDVDRDGLLDFVVTNWTGDTASLRFGEGDGNFSGGADLAVGDTPRWVALGDVNTDGILDAVAANWNSHNVSVLLGEEEGPVLRITKAVTPADPSWGEALTYTIQISNTGPITATGVLVTDTLPSTYLRDLAFSSAGATITDTGAVNDWTWQVADLAPGAGGMITVTGVLTDYVMFGEVFANTAEIGCAGGVTATASAEATVGSDCVPTFTVISAADSGPGTLRQGLDVICDGGVVDFDLSYPATITLTTGELARTGDVTITGPGATNLAVSGNSASRVITTSGSLTLTGLTVRDGSSTSAGGLDVAGDLVLSDTHFISNTADSEGAFAADGDVTISDSLFQGNAAGSDDNGCFSAPGFVVITQTEFINNTAGGYNGVFSCKAEVTISDSLFQGNTAGTGNGAGYALGDISISDSLFQGNQAGTYVGAIEAGGSLTVTNTDFISNTAGDHAGACYGGGQVTISDSLFQGNRALTGAIGAVEGGAGLTLSNTDFISNTAGMFAGAVGQWSEPGSVVITGTRFIDNCAGGFTGLVPVGAGALLLLGPSAIENTLFQGNSVAGSYPGGAIFIAMSDAAITSTTFLSNTAGTGGGAILVTNVGGALSLTLSDCDMVGNTAPGNGGAVLSMGATTVSGGTFQGNEAGALGGAIMMTGTAPLSLDGVTLCDNTAGEAGGGLWANGPTWITDSLFVGNVVTGTQGLGGGLYLKGLGGITDSHFQGNDSRGLGGGIALANAALGSSSVTLQGSEPESVVTITNTAILSNTAAWGGGGLVSDGAELSMYDSTVAYNVSDDGDGYGTGGGIQLMDVPQAGMFNCTIAHNIAAGANDDGGGGIMCYNYTDLAVLGLLHCTIVGNVSASDGGGLIALGTGETIFLMFNTLVAGNTALGGSSPDASGTAALGMGNVVGDATGLTGLDPDENQYGSSLSPLNALTGLLGDYGGDTLTIPLLPGSPAINAGIELEDYLFDQRGVSRVLPDAGAFESQGFSLSIVSGSGQATRVGSPFPQPLVAGVTSTYGEPVEGGRVTYAAPASGASAVPSPTVAAIGADGAASSQATANATTGIYEVAVTTRGAAQGVKFALTNRPPISAEGSVSGGPATLCPGAELSYTVLVTNTSVSDTVTNVVITAVLPAGATYTPGDATGTVAGVYSEVGGEQRITWTVASLVAGQVATAQLSLGTLATLPHGTVLTVLFGWDTTEVDGKALQVVSTISTDGCASAEAWAAGGPANLCPGYNLYYTVVITNASPNSALTNVVVTAAVPAGTWFAPGQATGTVNGVYSEAGGVKQITWIIPSVAVGQKVTAYLMLHTLSSLTNGTVITETFGWGGNLLEGGLLDVVSVVNTMGCEPAPPPDLVIHGVVSGGGGTGAPIAGATITATTCLPGVWVDVTDAEGRYQITIPGSVAAACAEVTLSVSAPGHSAAGGTYLVIDLRTNPVRDFVLDPYHMVWLPLMFK